MADPLGLINWKRAATGTVETIAGGLGISVAATSEVLSAGSATVLVVTLAGASVPTFSHGISEIVVGILENDNIIPPVSGAAVITLAFTGDIKRAKELDLISGAMNIGGNMGSWTVKMPKRIELFSVGTDLINSVIESKEMSECE